MLIDLVFFEGYLNVNWGILLVRFVFFGYFCLEGKYGKLFLVVVVVFFSLKFLMVEGIS